MGRLMLTFPLCLSLACKFPGPVQRDKLLVYYTIKQELSKLLVVISALSVGFHSSRLFKLCSMAILLFSTYHLWHILVP